MYKTFVRSATGYPNEHGEWRLVCAAHRRGIQREIKKVKWFRNGKVISDQAGFELAENDLFIKVSTCCIFLKMQMK